MNIFQKLAVKPWSDDAHVAMAPLGGFASPPAKIGLRFFLFVVSVLFFLLTAAFFMRRGMSDWVRLHPPAMLGLNTVVLIAASFALEYARRMGRAGNRQEFRTALLLGGVLTTAFLAGQVQVWADLRALGYYATMNPANAFFYLFTGIHALHMAGGLGAWVRAVNGAWSDDADMEDLALKADLCAAYWHYLLLIWLYVFGLLMVT